MELQKRRMVARNDFCEQQPKCAHIFFPLVSGDVNTRKEETPALFLIEVTTEAEHYPM